MLQPPTLSLSRSLLLSLPRSPVLLRFRRRARPWMMVPTTARADFGSHVFSVFFSSFLVRFFSFSGEPTAVDGGRGKPLLFRWFLLFPQVIFFLFNSDSSLFPFSLGLCFSLSASKHFSGEITTVPATVSSGETHRLVVELRWVSFSYFSSFWPIKEIFS